MVALFRHLDLDVGELQRVERVAGKVGAVALDVRPIDGVAIHDAVDPDLRHRHKPDPQQQNERNDEHGSRLQRGGQGWVIDFYTKMAKTVPAG